MPILEPALAQKFIDKTAKHFEPNINIMNDKGIIIASKDSSRIGDFHEVAYGLLNGTLDTGIVNESGKYIGTKPGVNLFIDYKNKHVGVICVTGNPESVHSFAGLVKTSMEAILEYEMQMEGERRKKDKTEQFLYHLLFEEKLDMSMAAIMAEELGIKKDLLRAPIIIKYDHNKYKTKKVTEALMKAERYTTQDIIAMARNEDIIILKAIDTRQSDGTKDYRYVLEGFLQDFLQKLPEDYKPNDFNIFVGSLQVDIAKYRDAYNHAIEVSLKTKEKSGIHFFNDYILNYFRSLVNIKTYDNIFSVYDSLFSEDEKKQITETVETLSMNNYNVVNSAKTLFIHRNTLLFRLNKIKDVLNIDPISSSADREFLNELAYYFANK